MNPYSNLPEKSFWKPAVASKSLFDIEELWDPKFRLRKKHKIATFGSCFAQYIGRALKHNGYKWLSTEPAPAGLSKENATKFNYDVFSSRTGNIYTTTLLEQWIDWSIGLKAVPDEIWCKNERYFDPFRPNIEPDGFASEQELIASREATLGSFRRCLEEADFFVFTLGLTEKWCNTDLGYEYPMCPGTIAGDFDPDVHEFSNMGYLEVSKALSRCIKKIRSVNKNMKFIFTVSPVPLTATYSGNHVLVATMESKSILRAVVGDLVQKRKFIDYFPSYEIINSPAFRATFFQPNMRTVNPRGVAFVMESFFSDQQRKFPAKKSVRLPSKELGSSEDAVCEEELLSAFG